MPLPKISHISLSGHKNSIFLLKFFFAFFVAEITVNCLNLLLR